MVTQDNLYNYIQNINLNINGRRKAIGRGPLTLGLYVATGIWSLVVMLDNGAHHVLVTRGTRNELWDAIRVFETAYDAVEGDW